MRLCECGCGQEVKLPKSHFRLGHNYPMKCPEVVAKISGDNNPMRRPEVLLKYCEARNQPGVIAKISGDKNPMKRPEVALKISQRMTGGNNPNKRPEIRRLHHQWHLLPENLIKFSGENNPMKRPEVVALFIGESNPNYRDGKSNEPYPLAFRKSLKERIRKRDGYRCRLCGVPQTECLRALDVHHIDHDKENLAETNLISLCQQCNGRCNSATFVPQFIPLIAS